MAAAPYFVIDGPRLGNQWEEDEFLRRVVKRMLRDPESTMQKCSNDLSRFGDRVVSELLPIARSMDIPENLPRLRHYDAWGKKVDEIVTCPGWKFMHDVAAEEGLISIGYKKDYGVDSRVIQFTKLFLFGSSSGLYNCPLAMTDGAANLLKPLIHNFPIAKEAYEHLTSRDPTKFWTSGQWMTERRGGSDVSGSTETVAKKQTDGTYKLYGYKWFTSATDANITITTARIEGQKQLSCFILHVRNAQSGELNNMNCIKLKNKLGTKQLPTAEMELVGSVAILISEEGRGIPMITSGMVNVTRVYNAISSCAAIRRIVALARDYSHRRSVFGALLSENALHLQTLARMEVSYRACLLFTMDTVRLMGIVEEGDDKATEDDRALLRMLTPLVKLYTAKVAVSQVSEGLECFGGQGYIEETGIPAILRDAQVLPIWEGTTNVLSHDLLRVFSHSKSSAIGAFSKVVNYRALTISASSILEEAGKQVFLALEHVRTRYGASNHSTARALAVSLARIYAASCLLEQAVASKDPIDQQVANRFIFHSEPLVEPIAFGENEDDFTRRIALDIPSFVSNPQPRGFGNIQSWDHKPRSKY